MSKQTIWNYLKQHTSLPDVSIAGIMGNMEAESNCEACRLQGDFSADRTKSKNYAQMVNEGTISVDSYMSDAQGWGLCQWTYYTRKLNLLKSCQSYGLGIEDEQGQLNFLLVEMQSEYPSMWRKLLNETKIYEAARIVCHEYERPAYENIGVRASAAQKIYDEFHGKDATPDDEWITDAIEFWESEKKRFNEEVDAKLEKLRGRLNGN